MFRLVLISVFAALAGVGCAGPATGASDPAARAATAGAAETLDSGVKPKTRPDGPPDKPVLLVPARVFDGMAREAHEGWVVLVEGEKIKAVGPAAEVKAPADARVIKLPGTTLLPGLIDAHTHVLLHPYNEAKWDDQVLREPLALRVCRATNHLRSVLQSGFTTIRDLGTEGAGYADVGLKQAVRARHHPRAAIARRDAGHRRASQLRAARLRPGVGHPAGSGGGRPAHAAPGGARPDRPGGRLDQGLRRHAEGADLFAGGAEADRRYGPPGGLSGVRRTPPRRRG